MGDLSAEPSMEEILSSIKRIIAEEGEGAPQRGRRQPRALPATSAVDAPMATNDDADEEVLELSDPMPVTRRPEADPRPQPRAPSPQPSSQPAAQGERPAEPIVSAQAAAASRGALDSLSRLMVKPEPGSDGTLEGLVREMLRPMLRDWMDANLPEMVEAMVAQEIKRISGAA